MMMVVMVGDDAAMMIWRSTQEWDIAMTATIDLTWGEHADLDDHVAEIRAGPQQGNRVHDWTSGAEEMSLAC
jgi:hypothetical protein